MEVSWAFVVLILYPALQVPALWYVVHRFDLRNDDGPRDPRGYNFREETSERADEHAGPGVCAYCGRDNQSGRQFCGNCLAPLR